MALSTAALVGFLGVQVAGAGVASAHTPAASVTCTSWSITASDYNGNVANTYSYSIDGGTAVTGTFGAGFGPFSGTFAAGSGNHTLVGYVHAADSTDPAYSPTYHLSTSNCSTSTSTSIAIPATPLPTPPSCTSAGVAAIPADTATVHWTLNGDVATATAQGNNVFIGGAKTETFTETVLPQLGPNDGACATHITATAPVFTNGNCATAPALTGDVARTGYTVTVTGTPGFGNTVTVTYSALPGYRLDGATAYTFTYAAQPDCGPVVVPPPPVVVPVTPPVVVPVPPTTVAPVTPTVAEAACPTSGTTTTPPSIVVPDTANVTYTVAPGPYVAGGTTLVTATAAPGFTFVQGGLPPRWAFIGPATSATQATYPVVFAAAPACAVVTAPTFANDVCKAGGATGSTLTLPASTGVDYSVDGTTTVAGTHPETDGSAVTVTARPQDGYTLVGTTSWTHQFDATPKCVKVKGIVLHNPRTGTPAAAATTTNDGSTLPFTGAPIGTLVLLGGVLTAAGGATCIGARRRRSAHQVM